MSIASPGPTARPGQPRTNHAARDSVAIAQASSGAGPFSVTHLVFHAPPGACHYCYPARLVGPAFKSSTLTDTETAIVNRCAGTLARFGLPPHVRCILRWTALSPLQRRNWTKAGFAACWNATRSTFCASVVDRGCTMQGRRSVLHWVPRDLATLETIIAELTQGQAQQTRLRKFLIELGLMPVEPATPSVSNAGRAERPQSVLPTIAEALPVRTEPLDLTMPGRRSHHADGWSVGQDADDKPGAAESLPDAPQRSQASSENRQGNDGLPRLPPMRGAVKAERADDAQ